MTESKRTRKTCKVDDCPRTPVTLEGVPGAGSGLCPAHWQTQRGLRERS